MPTQSRETLMSIQDVCSFLAVSNDTVYRWIKEKNFPAQMIGKRWKASLSDVEAWIKENNIGKKENKSNKKLRVLSLFSGGGGLDLGFEGGFDVIEEAVNGKIHPDWLTFKKNGWVHLPETKFETVFANDIDANAARAWNLYFSKRRNVKNIYHTISIVDLVKRQLAGEKLLPDNIDVVTGGFPCNDFSVAGKRNGFDSHRLHDGSLRTDEATEESRGKLYMWMKQVVEIVQPKVFFAENVKGLVSLADVKEIIENDFRHISGGYIVVPARVLYAPSYGVPQTRERVIFIGFKKSALSEEAYTALQSDKVPAEFDPYPVMTHGNSPDLLPYTTVKQAFKDLQEPDIACDISQKTFSCAKYMGSHCQGQKEVVLNAPGPTIRAEHHGNIEFRRLSQEHGGQHLEELQCGLRERRLTVRECARIQTFPDDYEFVVPRNKVVDLFGETDYKTGGF